jgi:sulfur carrier protein
MDIQIQLNGKTRLVPAGCSIARLLGELGLPLVGIAVERNRELVARERIGETILLEGDHLEVVTLVGGG